MFLNHFKKDKSFSEGMVGVFRKDGMGCMGEVRVEVRFVGDFQH